MADVVGQLNEHFASAGSTTLQPDLISELTSILRVYSLTPEELRWKWDAYCMRLGKNDASLDIKTAQELRADLKDNLERDGREKQQNKPREKRVMATPRTGGKGGDVFGMLDGLVPNTPHSNVNNKAKRKSDFDTPSAKAAKNNVNGTPNISSTPVTANNDRQASGTIQETLNPHISIPDPPSQPPTESRIKLKANTEMSKFTYKTMAMKLSEASEILDDRIDEFAAMIKEHNKIDDDNFGNPCVQSPNEVVAVGRIACDSSEGKLNTASVLLETSRRTGAGMRVALKLGPGLAYDLFPGKIVAVRGANPSGEYFTVTEFLEISPLPPSASSAADLDAVNSRLQGNVQQEEEQDSGVRPLNILIASGPYTTEADLDFGGLETIIAKAQESRVDGLVLFGPFLDTEHEQIRTGDFDLPANAAAEPDRATLADLFRHRISTPLQKLAQQLPSISIVLVPSVRDAVSKQVAWPQDRLPRQGLGLPKQAQIVTNPVTLSINELVVGFSSLDSLEQLRATTLTGGSAMKDNVLARLVRQMIDQRHFFPVYPPLDRQALQKQSKDAATDIDNDDQPMSIGAPLDLAYLKLAEWVYVKPDLLVVPSATLPPFAKVVNSVLAVNPGSVMKRKGAGTYARLTIAPLQLSDEDRLQGKMIPHKLWERSRVDIIKT